MTIEGMDQTAENGAGNDPDAPAQPEVPMLEQTLPNGFLVSIEDDGAGKIDVAVHPVGDARLTEAPAALGMALASVRQKFGL